MLHIVSNNLWSHIYHRDDEMIKTVESGLVDTKYYLTLLLAKSCRKIAIFLFICEAAS